jgi:predicted alpha-1,2-mannosidase
MMILRYFFYLTGSLLLILALVITGIIISYRNTVSAKPGLADIAFQPGELGRYADPFVGTGGFPPYVSGATTPGATLPFGMVRLSPDTQFFLEGFPGRKSIGLFSGGQNVNSGGYYYGDRKMMGFSHTRLIGTGAWDGGQFRVVPGTGGKTEKKYRNGRYLKFSHNNEIAFPGYYAVNFPRKGILAELTASERTGVHRYTFSKNSIAEILIDVSSTLGNGRTTEGEIEIFPERQEITGSIRNFGSFSSRYGGAKVFFAARFSQPFLSYGVWTGDDELKNITSIKGDEAGVVVSFDNSDGFQEIELRLAISYVSVENAMANLEAETGGLSFEKIVSRAKQAWEDRLQLIKVTGGTEEQRRIFYSALYRSLQMPTVFNDINGQYKGFDKEIHNVTDFRYYTDMSLWDTFRTTHPLFTLIAPAEQRDMMVSLVKMSKQGGMLPRWPSGYGYTGSMLGASADIVIAEAYLKGIRDFDVQAAYQAMRRAALGIDIPEAGYRPRPGISEYLEYRYCPDDMMAQSVSRTLEYSYADDAISKLAKALGYEEDARLFARHSRYYENVWNPATRYFLSRNAAGDFVEKFDPLKLTYLDPKKEYTRGYVEGSALQWRWAVFFDPENLISLFGDREYFVDELNAFFEKSNPRRGRYTPGSYYWHGNEPDIHAAYLFNSAGRPDLTRKWVRWIMDNKYGDGYDGLDGDDDAGTLSAWYVFSAMGFYPVAGSDIYQAGTPLFEKTEVRIGDNLLTIIADNYSPENIYINSIWLNGKLLDRFWFRHQEIARGGTLRFEMSKLPKKD